MDTILLLWLDLSMSESIMLLILNIFAKITVKFYIKIYFIYISLTYGFEAFLFSESFHD